MLYFHTNMCIRALKAGLGRFKRAQGAATAVEFALIAPLLFALLLATTQIAVIFIAQSYLQTVAESTQRSVLTNQTAALTPTQFKNLVCANVGALFTCNSLIISLQTVPANATPASIAAALPTFNAQGALTSTPTIASIPPNTQAVLILMYQWPVIAGPLGAYFGTLGNGAYLLTSTQVFQTEPCSASTGC
jgi:Flp pilus assembly protein TadG